MLRDSNISQNNGVAPSDLFLKASARAFLLVPSSLLVEILEQEQRERFSPLYLMGRNPTSSTDWVIPSL